MAGRGVNHARKRNCHKKIAINGRERGRNGCPFPAHGGGQARRFGRGPRHARQRGRRGTRPWARRLLRLRRAGAGRGRVQGTARASRLARLGGSRGEAWRAGSWASSWARRLQGRDGVRGSWQLEAWASDAREREAGRGEEREARGEREVARWGRRLARRRWNGGWRLVDREHAR
jgi:hypothetical protein